MVQPFEDSLAVAYKTKHTLSRRSNTCVPSESKRILTQMCIAALFIITKTWKEPRCPSVGDWINGGPSRQWNIIRH